MESIYRAKITLRKYLLQTNKYILVFLEGSLHSELSKEDYKPFG